MTCHVNKLFRSYEMRYELGLPGKYFQMMPVKQFNARYFRKDFNPNLGGLFRGSLYGMGGGRGGGGGKITPSKNG